MGGAIPRAPRTLASSGWLPAAVLGVAGTIVLVAYGTPPWQVAIFSAYVAFGIAIPGMLWVRLLRGGPAHIAEDLTLGLLAGYAIEIATYLPARAVGAPLLVLAWPASTLIAFIALPALRRYWRGEGTRAPLWWSWSLAAILGYVLVYSAGTFFAQHQLAGTDTPYVDMPFHLALIGELRHHLPPATPYVTGLPLAYHWFFYAEAAATSWATSIEPVTLLYRLTGLPMFIAIVILTAAGARRLTGRWWPGPVAVAVALFGTVAGPYGWTDSPVFDTQTLPVSWISPTNLFGLALFAGVIVVLVELVGGDGAARRRHWLLVGLLIFAMAGAKASLMPLLIGGLFVVVAGAAIGHRRLERNGAAALILSAVALVLAEILLFRGATGGLVIGLDALRALPVVALPGSQAAHGASAVALPIAALLIALTLWSFLWAGAYGLLARARGSFDDPRILLLLGICGSALGAVALLSYPGLSQVYYLKGAAGAFGLLTAAGIAAVVPARGARRAIVASVAGAAIVGAVAVQVIRTLGPRDVPRLADAHLTGVLAAMAAPVVGMVAVTLVAAVLIARFAHRRPGLREAAPLLVIALVTGFSVPNVLGLLASPFADGATQHEVVPADGIAAARWLRDHSGPDDLVATNLHCRVPVAGSEPCDARHFWISAYSERHVLVEGWAYTQMAIVRSRALGLNPNVVPFWDPALLAQNDLAFTDPTSANVTALEASYGVRWLFADVTIADPAALGRVADLRDRVGDFAIYETRQP